MEGTLINGKYLLEYLQKTGENCLIEGEMRRFEHFG